MGIGNLSPVIKSNTSKFIKSKSFHFTSKKKELQKKNKNEVNNIGKPLYASQKKFSKNLIKSDNKIFFNENIKKLGFDDYFKSTRLEKNNDNKTKQIILY